MNMAGTDSEFWQALDDGATVVTANARLARDLRRDYDLRRRGRGDQWWPAADILDWNAWLRRTWDEAVRRGEAPAAVLLSAAQEHFVWERIIDADAGARGLFQIPATAAAAASAYELASAWRLPLNRTDCEGFEDAAAFIRWAAAYEDTLERRIWRCEAQIPGELTLIFQERRMPFPSRLFYAGFDEATPSEQRLMDALSQVGCRIEAAPIKAPESPRRVRVAVPDAAAELDAAAAWARERVASNPDARIGIVLPELDRRVAAVERAFEDALHASFEPVQDNRRPVFHISAGSRFDHTPVIAAAFQCLGLGLRALSVAQAGLLLRSPFLRGAQAEAGARALLDAELRRRGLAEVSPAELARLSSREDAEGRPRPYACPVLARSLRGWRRAGERMPSRQLPSLWSRTFSKLLRLNGWPGDRTLSSAEYQAIRRWNELLSEFAALDLIAERFSYSDALARLRRMASQARFGPADEHAPVQILGMLEAAGATFDHLWIAGLDDRAWPAPPRPNPFLPLPLQRRLGLPHSSAERELGYARRVLERLFESAPDVVASHSKREGDTDLRPSPLILELAEAEPLAPRTSMAVLLRSAGAGLERIEDRNGPPVEPGSPMRGGMAILERQAACPFSAFAQFRLNAQPLEEPGPGLSPQERGMIVHAALENFWREVRTLDALLACTPEQRAETIARAVSAAVESKVKGRGAASSKRLMVLERRRVERLVGRWLDVEARRTPFMVIEREEPRRVEAGGLAADVRVDRVDQLPDGREIVIDYKTGVSSPSAWESERPDAPQLPLYASKRQSDFAAVLFAQLAPADLRFKGLGESAGVPGCTEYSRSAPGKSARDTLADHIAQWGEIIDALGAEFCAGRAAVAPKDPGKCRNCAFPALCRVAELEAAIQDDATGDYGEAVADGGRS
jgi:ATP-dependent helicase/nuclease subunit B